MVGIVRLIVVVLVAADTGIWRGIIVPVMALVTIRDIGMCPC